jgi:DNA primase
VLRSDAVISRESVERVKSEAAIVAVVSETVKLRRAGMYYSGLCPFHSERSPSFFVRESTNSYTCYGCGASGNVISFVMAMRAMTFPDAVEYLASRFGIELKYEKSLKTGPSVDREKIFEVCRAAHMLYRRSIVQVKGGQGEFRKVGEYLKQRGLTSAAINEFGIGYAPSQRGVLVEALKQAHFDEEMMLLSGLVRRSAAGELYEFFRGRLMFPIFVDAKRLAGFGGRVVPGVLEPSYEQQSPKYLNSPETPIYHKSRTIYGLPQAMTAIREASEVYVVEGYMDVVGLWMKGVRNSVACCGTAMTEQHVKRFSGVCNRVHLLFDGDAAGRGAAAKAFVAARNADVDVAACFLPDGLDPDDFARAHSDDLAVALKSLPKAELIDVFVDGLLAKHGCSVTDKPGANLLGKLTDEVAKALSGVEREVVRSTLIARAARRLGIEITMLQRLIAPPSASPVVNQGGEKRPPARNLAHDSKSQLGGSASGGESQGSAETRGADALPRVDQEVLRAVMVLKAEICQDVLSNPEVCEHLQAETLHFISQLSLVLGQHDAEERQREAVKELLAGMGNSWKALWKDAYKRLKAGVSMRDVYQESLKMLKRHRLQRLLDECRQEMITGSQDPEEQLLLSERVRSIKTQLDAFVRGMDLASTNS